MTDPNGFFVRRDERGDYKKLPLHAPITGRASDSGEILTVTGQFDPKYDYGSTVPADGYYSEIPDLPHTNTWVEATRENNADFVAVQIAEYVYDNIPVTENMIKITGTDYYRFIILTASSLGPQALGSPIDPLDLGLWFLGLDGTTFTLTHPDNTTTVIDVPEAEGADHIDLSFDQNGGLLITFTVGGVIKLRWFNTQESDTVVDDIGPGATPYLVPTAWNVVLNSTEVLLVYSRDGDLRYRRQLDRYRDEYSLNVDNASDIIHADTDRLDSTVVLYFDTVAEEIRNIATPGTGHWTLDKVDDVTPTGEIEHLTVRPAVVYPERTEKIIVGSEGEIQSLGIEFVDIHRHSYSDPVHDIEPTGSITELQITDGTISRNSQDTMPSLSLTGATASGGSYMALVTHEAQNDTMPGLSIGGGSVDSVVTPESPTIVGYSSADPVSDDTTLTLTLPAATVENDYAIVTVMHRSDLDVPYGWDVVSSETVLASGSGENTDQHTTIISKYIDSNDSLDVTITQSASGRMEASAVVVNALYRFGAAVTATDNDNTTVGVRDVPMANITGDKMGRFAVTAASWVEAEETAAATSIGIVSSGWDQITPNERTVDAQTTPVSNAIRLGAAHRIVDEGTTVGGHFTRTQTEDWAPGYASVSALFGYTPSTIDVVANSDTVIDRAPSITVNIPPEATEGDLLVAGVFLRGDLEIPSGWMVESRVAYPNTGGTQGSKQVTYILSHRVGSVAPTDVVFSYRDGDNRIGGHVAVVRGNANVIPNIAIPRSTATKASNYQLPDITAQGGDTISINTMSWTAAPINSATSVNINNGWEAISKLDSPASPADGTIRLGMAKKHIVPGGDLSGRWRNTPNTDSSYGSATMFFGYKGDDIRVTDCSDLVLDVGETISVDIPTDVSVGDLMMLMVKHGEGLVTPTGWSLVEQSPYADANPGDDVLSAVSVFTRINDGTEPTSLTLTQDAATTPQFGAQVINLSVPSGTLEVKSQQSMADSTTVGRDLSIAQPASVNRHTLAISATGWIATPSSGVSAGSAPSGWAQTTPSESPSTATTDKLRMCVGYKRVNPNESISGTFDVPDVSGEAMWSNVTLLVGVI